mmetsp:Transcript_19454/g.42533  ORF Transcript_19454/g.42533 Transcript_19454/m.42533 type:complete len:209 (+) Transcript_19454:2-628(+)
MVRALGTALSPSSSMKGEEVSPIEAKKKIDRTISWYNKHGGLQAELDWKSTSTRLKKLSYRQATTILKKLEETGPTLGNPTGWVISQCNKMGANGTKAGREKIGSTILWWNRHGGLEAEGKAIRYDEVAGPLSNVPPGRALAILKELGENKDKIHDPTGWIVGYMRKLENQGEAGPDWWRKENTPRWGGWKDQQGRGQQADWSRKSWK